jgi:hypothetical protein
MRFGGVKVRNIVSDMERNGFTANELLKRVEGFDLIELRQLGRLLLERAKQEGTVETNECIAMLRRRCRR